MDSTKFPLKIGGDLGGKSFLEILNTLPKIVEFVDSLWIGDKTTGIFHEFYIYIKTMLKNPTIKAEHQKRAREYVKTVSDIPSYMRKYCSNGPMQKTYLP